MKKAVFLALIFVFALFGNCLASADIKIHFIDVGYGDAILIECEEGNAMIDTGGLLSGYRVADYLSKHKIKRLNYLFLTHPDSDHTAGVFFITPKLKIDAFFDNGQPLDLTEDAHDWYNNLVRGNSSYRVLKAGDSLRLGKIVFNVVWPDKIDLKNSFNANSMVLMLTYGKFKCLFAADLTKESEQELLHNGQNLKSDILKIGHHGYKDATAQEFLEAVRPKVTVISAGEKKRRGTPSEEVIKRLKDNSICVYRTDLNGNIVVVVYNNGKFQVNTEK